MLVCALENPFVLQPETTKGNLPLIFSIDARWKNSLDSLTLESKPQNTQNFVMEIFAAALNLDQIVFIWHNYLPLPLLKQNGAN